MTISKIVKYYCKIANIKYNDNNDNGNKYKDINKRKIDNNKNT